MNNNNIGAPKKEFAQFCRKVAAQGAVLLKNEEQNLPITKKDRVSVFGRCQINYYRSGTGSGGSVNVPYTTNLIDGLKTKDIELNTKLVDVYANWVKENPFDNGGGGWASEPWNQKEMPLTHDIVKEALSVSEKAVIVIGRTAGEDKDNAVERGSFLLTEDEEEMLNLVCNYFTNVTVVLNVSNIIDMSWLDDSILSKSIKSVIYTWQGGMEGGNAAADVLVGDVVPSGKLTDTIAYSISDYPSTENYGDPIRNFYKEDIYVGYRYFETFTPNKVRYEFGYGLSYTTFSVKQCSGKIVANGRDKTIELEIEVKNTGTKYSGKEVVQVYFEAPQGKLGRPKRQLVAFKKTRELKPGESETLLINFSGEKMAAYDDSGVTGNKSCYVLEEGLYSIFFGTSVKILEEAFIDNRKGFEVTELIVVDKLQEALSPSLGFQRIKPGALKADGTYEISFEDVPTRSFDLRERIKKHLPKEISYTGDKGYKLRDVYDKKINIEAFVAQFDDADLSTIVRGEGMCSPLVTPGTASAFGGVSDSLFNKGIPVACTADGPSGIRMDSGHEATQVPIGTLLAATWDVDLVYELYVFEGVELLENKIDMLLGPGLNIRRNPLNGRNFEYFSEDPLVTGLFATANVKGLMKGGSNGVLKHFACNNQEKARSVVDAVVSERALREIYLKGFEMAVRDGRANGIMTAYNPVNGFWTASNYDLNTTILRKEWGFRGIVMTDWWASMNDVVLGGKESKQNTKAMVQSQNDLYMVVNNYGAEVNSAKDNTIESLENGSLTRGELQRCAINILEFIITAPVFFRRQDTNRVIEKFEASSVALVNPVILERGTRVSINGQKEINLNVSEAGIYKILVNIMSPMHNLAQTACNFSLNNKVVTTIQTSGTHGHWILQNLIKIELEKGFYTLNLEVIKPEIHVDWIEFQ
jgi:beta-glucosidase